MTEPWRYACPKDHRALKWRHSGWYCSSCKQSYDDAEITDLKRGVTV